MPEISSIVHLVIAILATLFAIIVVGVTNDRLISPFFGSSTAVCYLGSPRPLAFPSSRGCDTAVGIGAVGLIAGFIVIAMAVVELVGVTVLAFLNSKPVNLVRAVACGVLAFLFLVAFGVVVDDFNSNSLAKANAEGRKSDGEAVAAFCFFSIAAWTALVVMYVIRVIKGTSSSSSAPSASVA
eukprot:scpid87939/ scgid32384/ 